MATDKRDQQKENIQNVQPPASAPEPGIEGAYYGDKPLPKYSPSLAVQMVKEERHGAKQGAGEQQPQGPQGSQGRRPPVLEVTTVEPKHGEAGKGKKSAETETEWNRHDKKG